MTNSTVQVPSYADIDSYLDMQTNHDGRPCNLRVIKAAVYDEEAQDWDELPILEGFGSSEIQDADGDTFHDSALKSLCTADEGLNTWRNHKLEVPETWMGWLAEAPHIATGPKDWPGAIPPPHDGWKGVRIRSEVHMKNPPARSLYELMAPTKRGKQPRLGWSVGCMYTNYKRKTDRRGTIKGFDVFEVKPIEWSIVGVPSNQQSWVECTRKHFVAKGIIPAGPNDAEMLYAFKHWSELPDKDAVKLRRLNDMLRDTYGLALGEPADRTSWAGHSAGRT